MFMVRTRLFRFERSGENHEESVGLTCTVMPPIPDGSNTTEKKLLTLKIYGIAILLNTSLTSQDSQPRGAGEEFFLCKERWLDHDPLPISGIFNKSSNVETLREELQIRGKRLRNPRGTPLTRADIPSHTSSAPSNHDISQIFVNTHSKQRHTICAHLTQCLDQPKLVPHTHPLQPPDLHSRVYTCQAPTPFTTNPKTYSPSRNQVPSTNILLDRPPLRTSYRCRPKSAPKSRDYKRWLNKSGGV